MIFISCCQFRNPLHALAQVFRPIDFKCNLFPHTLVNMGDCLAKAVNGLARIRSAHCLSVNVCMRPCDIVVDRDYFGSKGLRGKC